MSLEGNLTSFGLSEIIQLIAVQQKTGMLAVTRESNSVKMYFREGRIISTRDRRKGAADPLKEYFTRYGIITGAELARLGELSARAKLDITDVILSEKLMSEEELRRHCRNHIQETLYEILTWEQCGYKFVAGSQITEGVKVLAELTVEGMLMESMRWIDEFPLMLEEFPHGAATVQRREGAETPEDLSPLETSLLEMLTRGRSVDFVVAHAKAPKFETYEALRQLKERRLIEVEAAPAPAEETPSVEPARRRRAKPRKNPLPLVLAVGLCLGCGIWGARDIVDIRDRLGFSSESSISPIASDDRLLVEEGLRWCLETYRAKHGRYPDDLSILEASGIGTVSFFERAGRYSFQYHLTPGGYRYILL